MNKTQKIRRLGWALTVGLLLFSVQPAYPKPKTPRAKTTPAPIARDRSEFAGEGDDAASANEITTITQRALDNEKAISTLPPGPERERRERDRQQFVGQGDAVVDGCPSCPLTLTNGALMADKMGEALKSPEFTAKAHGLADRAVSAAEQATNDPKQADKLANALTTRGSFLEKAGEFERAHADAKYALKVKPGDKAALGLLHSTAGRTKAGSSPAVQATAPAPAFVRTPAPAAPFVPTPAAPNVKSFLDRAANLIGMRDYRGAIDSAQRAAALDPSNPDPHMQQAVAWAALKNVSEAMLAISRAIERLAEGDPRLPGAYNTRALFKNKDGNYAGAAADAGEAIKRDPGMADAYYQRSVAQKGQGNKAESVADLKKAAELKPSDYKSLYDVAAREMDETAGASVPDSRQKSALHQTWTRLLGKAGGGFKLFMGTMGALFVLFAGCVLWFAKEGSPASRVRSFFTRRSQIVTVTTPVSAEEPREIGGHIELRREIDRGGMGVIYEAFDKNLKRPVAVKRLLPELQNEDLLKRILAEAQTLALFHHPHIVEIYEVITEGKDIFLVQPLLDGHTVYVELNESPGRRLTTERTFEIALAVASAIDYSHAKGVIHRDLKPSNIMVTKDGRILVMDYGIAKSNVNHSQITKTGMSVGTPAYMAPEQEMGKVCRQSDVFALAASLYEMLSGRLPFGMNDLFRKLQKEPGKFVAPSSLILGLPPAVDAVFEKGLAAEPGDRQKTCTELVQDLKAAFRQPTPPLA